MSDAAGSATSSQPGPASSAIEVVAYDPAWPIRFDAIRDRLAAALGEVMSILREEGIDEPTLASIRAANAPP